MCELNFVIKRDGKPSKQVTNLMNVLTWGSFVNNSDAEGYISLTNGLVYDRSLMKIIYTGKESVLFTHQRLMTSGSGINNAHPHESKDFLLLHNGVFNNLGNAQKSDSKIYLEKLQAEFDQCKDIVKAIQEVNSQCDGTYSILLVYKPTADVFYYKDMSTKMSLLRSTGMDIMCTNQDNIEYARGYVGIEEQAEEIEDGKIFNVMENMKEIGEFEEAQPRPLYYTGGYHRTGGFMYYDMNDFDKRKRFFHMNGDNYWDSKKMIYRNIYEMTESELTELAKEEQDDYMDYCR